MILLKRETTTFSTPQFKVTIRELMEYIHQHNEDLLLKYS